MSELPKGWVNAKLSDVTIPFETMDPTRLPDEKFEYIDIGSIDNQTQTIRDPKSLVGRDAPSRARRVVHTGDVLFSTVRTYLKNIAMVPETLDGMLTSTGIAVLRPGQAVDGRYLFNWVKSDDFIATMSSAQDGTLYPAVTDKDVAGALIPLPPLPEQKRIVAKVDGLTARTARARTDLDRIPTLIARYKQRLLDLAFAGALTAEWRKAQGGEVDYISAQHALWRVPESWEWLQVDQVGDVGLGRQRSPKNHNGPDMRPYIRSANITWAGVDISDVKEMNFDAKDFERFQLKYGDVLLNEGSGSAKEVGKPAIWRDEIPNCCYQNTVLRVQPKKCSSEFLYWYFLSTALSERFVSNTQGMNIQHISKNGLAKYMVPVPSREEQTEIVRRIGSTFDWLDRMMRDHHAASLLLPKLDAAILAKAFRGELVPQDSNDEPASVLLERIKGANFYTEVKKSSKSNRTRSQTRGKKAAAPMIKNRNDKDVRDQPYLASILRARSTATTPEELFSLSGLPLHEFYHQLAQEHDSGWLQEADGKVKAI